VKVINKLLLLKQEDDLLLPKFNQLTLIVTNQYL